jgi:hypothetical protein
MKTLKSILAGVALLFVCIAANAAVKHVSPNLSKDDVVNMYINAIANGKTDNLDKAFDDNLQFNLQRGENVQTLDKDQLLSYLKGNTVSATPVNTTTDIMQEDDASEKLKIQFKYDGYTRTDVVVLNKTFGWQITNVSSSFK